MSGERTNNSWRLLAVILVISCFFSVGLFLNRSGSVSKVHFDSSYAYEPHVFTQWDLGFVDSKSNAIIRLGMTRRQVEAAIGEPLGEASWLLKQYRIDKLTIKFRDNKVVGLILAADTPRFHTVRGVGIATTDEERIRKYGEAEYGQYSLLYEDGKYTLREDSTTRVKTYERARSYFLVFAVKDGKVSTIMIGDYLFGTTPI